MKSGTAILLAVLIGLAPSVFGPALAEDALPYGFRLPLPAGYRLSAGVAVNGNKVTLNALANGTGTVTVNRTTWSTGGYVADSRNGFKDLAPYAGIGYTEYLGHSVKVSWDAGALFGSAPMLPPSALPGLPGDLSLQTYWLETQHRSDAVSPLAEVSLGLRF